MSRLNMTLLFLLAALALAPLLLAPLIKPGAVTSLPINDFLHLDEENSDGMVRLLSKPTISSHGPKRGFLVAAVDVSSRAMANRICAHGPYFSQSLLHFVDERPDRAVEAERLSGNDPVLVGYIEREVPGLSVESARLIDPDRHWDLKPQLPVYVCQGASFRRVAEKALK